jgi:hypothetical protein
MLLGEQAAILQLRDTFIAARVSAATACFVALFCQLSTQQHAQISDTVGQLGSVGVQLGIIMTDMYTCAALPCLCVHLKCGYTADAVINGCITLSSADTWVFACVCSPPVRTQTSSQMGLSPGFVLLA